MSSQNTKKSMAKIVAAMLVGAVGASFYGADAKGLTGSYVGIGSAPTSEQVIDKGGQATVGQDKLIDYRSTWNSATNQAEDRKPANDNKNGEGVDGNNASDGAGAGNMSIGLGAYTGRGFGTAIGTYSSAIMNSTALGAGTYASRYSSAIGRNAYANSKAVAVGEGTRAADGVAIGYGASAGKYYKYIQKTSGQNEDSIQYSIAIGTKAKSVGGVALGAGATTNGLYAVALGQNASVRYSGAAVGTGARVTVDNGVALGTYAVANRAGGSYGFVPFANDSVGAIATNDTELANYIGANDTIKNFTTTYATEISELAALNKAYSDAVAEADKQDKVILVTKGSTNPTEQAQYTAAKAVKKTASDAAVKATSDRNAWLKSHSDFSKASAEYRTALAAFKATDGAVSVGSTTGVDTLSGQPVQSTRQIINVAAGTEDTDAVNVAQLKAVANVVDDKMSDFTVGADKAAQKGGITVDATDENKRFDIVGADDNITTNVDGRTITVGLGNILNLTATGSVQFGSATTDTKLDATGLTVNNTTNLGTDLKFTSSGISAGNQVVENVKSDIVDEAGDTYLTKLSTANDNNPNSAVNVSDLQSTASALDTKITKAGDDITTINTNIGKLQTGFNVAAGNNTSTVALGGDTAPTITFAGDANVTATLDTATNTVAYTLNKDGITTTLGDTFAKLDASNLQGDTTNINNWKTVLGVTDTALGQASAWKLQANTDTANASTIAKDDTVIFANGTGTEVKKTDNTITVGLDDATNTKINNITNIGGDVTKLQAGFNVAAGNNTSTVALGGDTAPTITFAGDANVTATLDTATNTVAYTLNKDGITTTLGDTFAKLDASNLKGDTTNINNWKTVLGITDTALGQASAWRLQANTDTANASTIAKDDTVIFANGTGTEVKKTDNTITVGLDDATNTKINNITNIGGDVTKLQAGFNVAAGNNTSTVALGGDTAPTITFAGDANVTATLDTATNTVAYTLNKDGITTTLGDTFAKLDASNLQGDTTNINNWKTVLGVTDTALGQASAWKLQANTDTANASTIAKDDTVIFANGTGTEVKKTDNTITVGLDDATNTKINNITNIGGDVTKLQAGFNVAAGNNTSTVALGGDTAPTITFAGDANVTATLDTATNTVAYTLNKDGITTTLGDTFAKLDASNLKGDTTNINNWKTVLGITDTALGQASAWRLQANTDTANASTIAKDDTVIFANGTGTEVKKTDNTITVGLDDATNTKINNITNIGGDVTKLQAGFNVAAGNNTSTVALGGDTAPTITFAGDANVTATLDTATNTVAYTLNKDGITTTLGDTFAKLDASNLQGDTTNINNWKTVLGVTDTALGQASAWKLQANTDTANASTIAKDDTVIFANGTGTEVKKTDNTITVGLDDATNTKINNITNIGGDVTKLQAGFNVAAGNNTSTVALGGDTAPTITFAGDANVTATLDTATNTVAYTLNKDGITTTLGDTFAKLDASNLKGDTTNINNWKTVLGITDTALGQASAWRLQANTDTANASTIAKDDTVIFANGTGTEVKKTDNTITVGLDDATNTKINNITNIGGDVTKLQAGFNVAAGNNTSTVALGGDTAPTITFAGDANVTATLDTATNTVAYTLNKDGITTTLGDTFAKLDASNLKGDTTNINNWKTVLGITDTALGQASAWRLQANTDTANASTIAKDDTVIFANGTSTEVTKNDNTITVDLNGTTKNQIINNTKEIGDIKKDVKNINDKIENIVTNDGNLNIQGDDATGVVVGPADANDPKKGLKVSLGDTIKVGDITLSGKDGNSTLTGLSNTTWDESNFQANRAATEGQLKDFMGRVNDNVTPTKIKGDDNIHVKEVSKNNFELSLDKNLNVENSISVGGDTYISKEGINANDKVITNVGESKLEAGSKNAATVNQVVEVRDELNETIGNVAGAVQDNMRQMAKLDDRMNKVGAGAAALAGLHPLEFNPDDKFSAAVAMGSYKGQGAAALGGFYRPNADTMFSVSSTLGDETMFNIGVSLKFGQKGDDVYRNPNNTSFRDLTNEVASLKEENKALNDKMTEKEKSFEATNKALNDKVTAQQVELEQQRALIQQLMAKVGM